MPWLGVVMGGRKLVVAHNFVPVERDQSFLMPPSMTEWLDEDHLVWLVLEIVGELDLSGFEAAYRADGRGGQAYDPAMMVGLLVYAYCVGERSSRRIERLLVTDVAFRVVAANQRPDHTTIARFRAGHQDAVAGLFGQVLAVCAKAGLLASGVVAVDGTKLAASASMGANRTAKQLAAEILAQAEAVDAVEDAAEAAATQGQPVADPGLGRRGAARRERVRQVLAQLEAEAEERSYDEHMRRRAVVEAETGRKLPGNPPSPDSAMFKSRELGNLTDPDSRLLKCRKGWLQGYNVQAVANEAQVVVAAQATNDAVDTAWFVPMMEQTVENLAGLEGAVQVRQSLADAGYWAVGNTEFAGMEVLVSPSQAHKLGKLTQREQDRCLVLARLEAGEISKDEAGTLIGVGRSRLNHILRLRAENGDHTLTATMMARLGTPQGRADYKRRKAIIEPVFGQIKHCRGIRQLARRGLAAADSEWKLICTAHNILKIHKTRLT